MDVIAKELGFYNGRRRKKGDRFGLNPGDKPGKWMQPVGPEAGKPVKQAKPSPAAPASGASEGEDGLT